MHQIIVLLIIFISTLSTYSTQLTQCKSVSKLEMKKVIYTNVNSNWCDRDKKGRLIMNRVHAELDFSHYCIPIKRGDHR